MIDPQELSFALRRVCEMADAHLQSQPKLDDLDNDMLSMMERVADYLRREHPFTEPEPTERRSRLLVLDDPGDIAKAKKLIEAAANVPAAGYDCEPCQDTRHVLRFDRNGRVQVSTEDCPHCRPKVTIAETKATRPRWMYDQDGCLVGEHQWGEETGVRDRDPWDDLHDEADGDFLEVAGESLYPGARLNQLQRDRLTTLAENAANPQVRLSARAILRADPTLEDCSMEWRGVTLTPGMELTTDQRNYLRAACSAGRDVERLVARAILDAEPARRPPVPPHRTYHG